MSNDVPHALPERPLLLDAAQAGEVSNVSARTVYRLSARGLMPAPVRLGALVRWQRRAIEQWIADGCPATRRTEVARGR